MKEKRITWCVANVHAQHTNTHDCARCTVAQTHTLMSKASQPFTGGGEGGEQEAPPPAATAQEISEGKK